MLLEECVNRLGYPQIASNFEQHMWESSYGIYLPKLITGQSNIYLGKWFHIGSITMWVICLGRNMLGSHNWRFPCFSGWHFKSCHSTLQHSINQTLIPHICWTRICVLCTTVETEKAIPCWLTSEFFLLSTCEINLQNNFVPVLPKCLVSFRLCLIQIPRV